MTYESLTENWAKHFHGTLEEISSLEKEKLMAWVLTKATKLVSVVYPEGDLKLKWADGQERSSLVSKTIVLNPDPLFDDSREVSLFNRIDVVVADAVKQAGHRISAHKAAESNIRLWGHNQAKEEIAYQIWSAAEYAIAKERTLKENPGYQSLFNAYENYYQFDERRDKIQAAIDSTQEQTHFKVALAAIVWCITRGAELNLKSYYTPVFEVWDKVEQPSVKDCIDRALASVKAAEWLLYYYGLKEEYSKKLKDHKEKEKREENQKAQEKKEKDSEDSENKDSSDESDSGEPGTPEKVDPDALEQAALEDCPNPEDLGISDLLQESEKVSPEELQKAIQEEEDFEDAYEKMVRDFIESEDEDEELNEDFSIPNMNSANPKVVEHNLTRPTPVSQSLYKEDLNRVRTLIPQLLNKLKFRNEETKFREHGLRKGLVDPGGIYKMGYGDYNIFEQEEIISAPKVHIALLIDESGSMGSKVSGGFCRVDLARQSAILLAETLKRINGVEFEVYGHSGDRNCDFYIYCDSKSKQLSSLGAIEARSQNLDGHAIKKAGEKLLKSAANDADKFLIHISDGLPAGLGYGGKEAMKHVSLVCKSLNRQGLKTLSVGIGDVSDRDMSLMYGKDYFNINKVSSLPQKLSKLVLDTLKKGN